MPAARRFSVVAGGVALLTVSALTARVWLPEGAAPVALRGASLMHDAPAPQVWLSSLATPEATSPFAAHSYDAGSVLPRVTPERPALAPRAAPPVAEVAATPVTPPPAADHQPIHVATGPEPVLPHQPIARRAPHALIDPQVAVAALRAPTRSLVPQRRPLVEAPTDAAPVQTAENDEVETQLALARSLAPQRRPEAVTRLASLALETPQVAVRTPAPQTATLAVPALPRAPARADSCESRLTREIPRRRGSADDGSQVIARLGNANGRDRDSAVISEVMAGNIPDHLRDLVPVTFTGTGPGGQDTRVTICVMPDYLAVGSDRDFVRVPLGLPAAMQVAERFDMVLPTTRMVDAIYQQASVRLAPAPMTPGAQMETTGYFQRHNATVQQQMASAGAHLGQLVSGHKKDLVLTNRLDQNPGRVAIYGWHRPNGRPIQPLSTVHGAQYADYSHGIRLVARRAYVNGRAVDLRDLLSDGRYAGLVSSEGPISNRTLLAALR